MTAKALLRKIKNSHAFIVLTVFQCSENRCPHGHCDLYPCGDELKKSGHTEQM